MNRKRQLTTRGEGKRVVGTDIRIVRNITIDTAQADALNEVQNKLESVLGFRPNLSQTIQWMLRNVQWNVVRMVIDAPGAVKEQGK